MSQSQAPPGVPPKLWIVVQRNGDRHFVQREPLEGIAAWAVGQDVTVLEYSFERIAYAGKPKKKAEKK